jgi:hypothetical protein
MERRWINKHRCRRGPQPPTSAAIIDLRSRSRTPRRGALYAFGSDAAGGDALAIAEPSIGIRRADDDYYEGPR